MTVPGADAAGELERDGELLAEVRLAPTLRASYLGRRIVGSLVTSGPRLRRLDATLLASELVSMRVPGEQPVLLTVTEAGRSVRIAVAGGRVGEPPDAIITNLLDRIADGWGTDGEAVWFEIELIRRHDLSGLDERELFDLIPGDREARDELFERYAAFAASLARRYLSRDRTRDDLEQVAFLGLVQALDRFDPAVGVKFTTFAGRWISGVLKRYLRDYTWSMRVPRSLKDGVLDASRTRDELTQWLGREPTGDELAESLGVSLRELHERMMAGDTYSLDSLDAPLDDGEREVGSLLGGEDPEVAIASDWNTIETVLDRLPERERQIVYLRFFEDLTQSEIAGMVGVSQVHVSRLLDKSLRTIRELLAEPEPAP